MDKLEILIGKLYKEVTPTGALLLTDLIDEIVKNLNGIKSTLETTAESDEDDKGVPTLNDTITEMG
jgi:hypothetical protein